MPTAQPLEVIDVLQRFVRAQRLPAGFESDAMAHYLPLCEQIYRKTLGLSRTLVLGINGCQGSGKSTLAALLETLLESHFGLRCCAMSIDDFYMTRGQREEMAERVHPLLATRGVPGTHDTALLAQTLHALTASSSTIAVPLFDKARDDRVDMARWRKVLAPVDVILLEGWCVGIPPQTDAQLRAPVNELEAREDPAGRWRQYVNARLSYDYHDIFARLDGCLMLKAPAFSCVHRWRLEQEQRLARTGSGARLMTSEAIGRFIQHYQRLTEHALDVLPEQAHWVAYLDTHRRITTTIDRMQSLSPGETLV